MDNNISNNREIDKAQALSQFDLDAYASDNTAKEPQEASPRKDVPTPHVSCTSTDDLYKDVKEAADWLAMNRIDITANYKDWVDIAYALANGWASKAEPSTIR